MLFWKNRYPLHLELLMCYSTSGDSNAFCLFEMTEKAESWRRQIRRIQRMLEGLQLQLGDVFLMHSSCVNRSIVITNICSALVSFEVEKTPCPKDPRNIRNFRAKFPHNVNMHNSGTAPKLEKQGTITMWWLRFHFSRRSFFRETLFERIAPTHRNEPIKWCFIFCHDVFEESASKLRSKFEWLAAVLTSWIWGQITSTISWLAYWRDDWILLCESV